jgi:hypothetical protein
VGAGVLVGALVFVAVVVWGTAEVVEVVVAVGEEQETASAVAIVRRHSTGTIVFLVTFPSLSVECA